MGNKKRPITIVLTEETHTELVKRAALESRPVAQMARVIIERVLNPTIGFPGQPGFGDRITPFKIKRD